MYLLSHSVLYVLHILGNKPRSFVVLKLYHAKGSYESNEEDFSRKDFDQKAFHSHFVALFKLPKNAFCTVQYFIKESEVFQRKFLRLRNTSEYSSYARCPIS